MRPTKTGVIGWPIGHSLSPVMHNAAFKALGLDEEGWTYDANAIPPDVLKKSVVEFGRHGYMGLNVTIPFKRDVMSFTRPDEIAQAVGAANTLILPRNKATNTDVAGFINDLRAHDLPISDMKVVLLGAGGAARAALYGLYEASATVAVVNRTPANALEMIADMGIAAAVKSVDEVLAWGADLVVNCTPVGMAPKVDPSPWPRQIPLPDGAVVYDMVYRPAKTTLMIQAETQGLRAIGGLGMLVRQGAASFEIWTGRDAPVDVMFDAAKAVLQEESS
ncbi:MAG: shikimate dehydrogenase [Chloroflexota bacterium]